MQQGYFRPALDKLVPYAPGLRAEQVQEKCPGKHICKLSSNESPRGPFESAKQAMVAAIDGLNEYPDGAATDLKAAISKFYGVDPKYIVAGAGSNELLDILAMCLISEGDEIVYPWPSFVVYPASTDKMDGTKVPVPLDKDFRVDLDGLLAAITPKTKLVYICNPNNPSSTALTEAELDSFMDRVPDHVAVVFDEAYIEFADPGTTVSGLKYFDGNRNVLVLRTFSKAYGMAGVRCGYGIVPEDFVAAIDKIRAPFNVTTLAQVAGAASLGDQEELANRVALNKRNRERTEAALDELGLTRAKSQTNFVFFEVPEAQKVFEELLARGIIVRPQGPTNYLRITIGDDEETTQLIEALNEILG